MSERSETYGTTGAPGVDCRCCERTFHGSGSTDGLCAACAATAAAGGGHQGLRLGALQERRLRAWPKDRIRPKSVALGVISLLAEVDRLRTERDAFRHTAGLHLDRLRQLEEIARAHADCEATIRVLTEQLALASEAAMTKHLTVVGAFVEHHDNGQTGQPGYPWTYVQLKVWQSEWDKRYAALRALVGKQEP